MISKGRAKITKEGLLSKTTESEILYHYFGVKKVPCKICSPLREDENPSFSFFEKDGNIFYRDFSNGDKGDIFNLLEAKFQLGYGATLAKIDKDMALNSSTFEYITFNSNKKKNNSNLDADTKLECKVREWNKDDISYWESYGISIKWLKYAEIYPISHKIFIKHHIKYVYVADKYAYAFVERKEGNVTLKIYQPYNRDGYKWCNKHDSSVVSLWTKIPYKGENLCICSSMKDALCLWANTNIPCIAPQGEGYSLSKTAITELKKRYKHIYILFDSDNAGINDSQKLASETGFKQLILPKTEKGKDISDIYHFYGKQYLISMISELLVS